MLDIAHPSHVVTHTRPPRGKPWVNVRHRASGLHSPVQKWLHWAVAGLILLQYMAFDGMGRPFSEGVESGAMPYTVTTITHIALGVLVLVLASWRLVIRLRIGAPPPPEGEPEIATVAAKVAHVAPYVLLVALPITGLAPGSSEPKAWPLCMPTAPRRFSGCWSLTCSPSSCTRSGGRPTFCLAWRKPGTGRNS